MALITLKQLLNQVVENSYGLPAFNVNNTEQIKAVMQAAEKNPKYANQVKIIYGGNLTPENSDALFNMENIGGGLVGCCFIDPQSFIKSCHVVDQLNCRERA